MAFEEYRSNFDHDTPVTRSRFRSFGAYLLEVVRVVIVALAIIIPIRYFLVQPFYVKGASMEPNFEDHEYLIIDELSYRFRAPERGDIVVFRYPYDPRQFFIKRIIGLPGERVEIRDGQVRISNDARPNGFLLSEGYLGPGVTTPGERMVVLGPEEFFVLGDNRRQSFDSKDFGPIPKQAIVGRAWLRGWPLEKFQTFHSPGYDAPPSAAAIDLRWRG
ncbi:signal peptidase I [Candidatus Uhrbacteria bacterium]|nr:signal peptidase I [Candidatus Uhrbacteria bacterium]